MFKQYIEATIIASSMTLECNPFLMILPSKPSTSSIVLYTDLDWKIRATAWGIRLSLADGPDVYRERTERRSHQHQLHIVVRRAATSWGSVVTVLEWLIKPEPMDKLYH